MKTFLAALVLEKGGVFYGRGIGVRQLVKGEIVFNTGMSGYQEVFTDPSYCGQIVVMTYPHIGNTGVNDEDMESRAVWLSGIVVREYCSHPSNYRCIKPLHLFLEERGVTLITQVDTRHITHLIREQGAQKAAIIPLERPAQSFSEGFLGELFSSFPSMEGRQLVSYVSTKRPYLFGQGGGKHRVVVLDFGVKYNILRHFERLGLEVWVLPYCSGVKEIEALKPSFVFLSNGPGDPGAVEAEVVGVIADLIERYPILAICMGHQLLARALGLKTRKLKFGHHGVNHPVKDLLLDRVLITSQNHGFCIEDPSSVSGVKLSHVSLNDGTPEGFVSEVYRLMSVQFHPEAAPGPCEASYLFSQFIRKYVV